MSIWILDNEIVTLNSFHSSTNTYFVSPEERRTLDFSLETFAVAEIFALCCGFVFSGTAKHPFQSFK